VGILRSHNTPDNRFGLPELTHIVEFTLLYLDLFCVYVWCFFAFKMFVSFQTRSHIIAELMQRYQCQTADALFVIFVYCKPSLIKCGRLRDTSLPSKQ